MSFFIEAKHYRDGNVIPAYIPVKERYSHIIKKDDPYQRATVCRGVFGVPFEGFAESIDIDYIFEKKAPIENQDDFLGEKWKELATRVAQATGHPLDRDEAQIQLRSLSAYLLKHKKLDKIFVTDQDKWVDCDILISGDAINVQHFDREWHIDQRQSDIKDYAEAKSLKSHTLRAVVALKDTTPGTLFYKKKTTKVNKQPGPRFSGDDTSDCRDLGDVNNEGISEQLMQGDLNLHAVHWTCHKVPERPHPSGVMQIEFDLPYECFDQVVKNLVARSMEEVQELRVQTLYRDEITKKERQRRYQSGDFF